MALKITRKEDPIEVSQLVVVIYGAPGLGKSTLAFTADKPILLDFDKGAYRAANRQDSVQIESWKDVTDITADDLIPYNTVIVDTAGRALDFLSADIIAKDPKKGYGGALTLQGYGVLKSRFASWLSSLKVIGKDVVLIAHSSEESKGDDIIERLDVQGGSKGEIYKSADAMGRLYLDNRKRTLSFSPTDTAFGKNPGNLSPIQVSDVSVKPDTLSEIISTVKTHLNELTEEQQKRQSMIADWIAKIQECKTPEDFNKMVTKVKQADDSILAIIKGELHKQATDAGLTYESVKNGYIKKDEVQK
jgi:hypothetical protein